MKDFIITTTPTLEGYKVKKYLDVVNENIVLGTNFFSDFAASFTDIFGGNSETYQGKMDAMYKQAIDGLKRKAIYLGANAILGFKVDFDQISGKNMSMFMLTASGTACVLNKEVQENFENKTSSFVTLESLSKELMKNDIKEHITFGQESLTTAEWQMLFDNPDYDVINCLLKNTYFMDNEDLKAKNEQLVKLLDYDDACKIVYKLYEMPFIVNFIGGASQKDVSYDYARIIRRCKLFNPEHVIGLIKSDVKKAVEVLDCEKPFYDQDDLKKMEEICDLLDNLPDTGKIEMAKANMFSKEKEMFICEEGHKNDVSDEYCVECFKNIKGLRSFEVEKISKFKRKTEILSSLLSRI